MNNSTNASRTLCTGLKAASYAVRSARVLVMACLAVCAIGVADGRAGKAIDQFTASLHLNCDRHAPSNRADGALRTDDQSAHSVPGDGTIATTAPIWKTITLGTHENGDALRRALNAARCRVGDLANEVLDQPDFIVSKSRTEVDLTVLSVADLGFDAEGASRAEIYRRAAQLGLRLCPPEVAPQLRLQYTDQPLGEFLHIAMEPMVTVNGDFVDLSLGNGGAGLLLIGGDARPDVIMQPTVRFVFVHHPIARMPTTAAAAQRKQREKVKD